MRTNFSWLIGSATVTLAAAGSVVATLWLLGLGPNGTESGVLQAGPDSRPAVYRAQALPRPHRAVPVRSAVAQRLRAAHAPVRVQLPHVRSALAPVDVTPSTETPHVAIRPHVVLTAPVPVPVPARPSVPALPTTPSHPRPRPSRPLRRPRRRSRPRPSRSPPRRPRPTRNWPPSRPSQAGLKKTAGKADKSAVPSRKPASQPSPTPGPVRPTLQDGDHDDSGSSKPKLDSSEQAKGNRHDKHKGD